MYHNTSSVVSLDGSRVKLVRNRFFGWKVEKGKAFMKKRKRAFFANSWMAKTEEKFLSKGKVFLVRASGGSDIAMEMIGKWYVVENRVRGFSGFESLDSISRMRFWDPFICLTEKSYLENQSFNLSNIFFGNSFTFEMKDIGEG